MNTPARRQVLTAITGGQLLVQLSSLPVTLALPSMARSFGTDLEEAAWIVILNLLVLGSTVLLGARLGDKFGHPQGILHRRHHNHRWRGGHRLISDIAVGDRLPGGAGTGGWADPR